MTYAARSTDFQSSPASYRRIAPTPAVKPKALTLRGLLQRLVASISESRHRQVQRDVERYIATHGRKMTDALEREINHRTLGDGWNFRR
ncbi:MAG: hypothetical protein GC182_11725 [Rhodopseudomonas sp.]|nr:hypothetical protein [Rhodopseudomonas sp.]